MLEIYIAKCYNIARDCLFKSGPVCFAEVSSFLERDRSNLMRDPPPARSEDTISPLEEDAGKLSGQLGPVSFVLFKC
jgi:hypothetical protein